MFIIPNVEVPIINIKNNIFIVNLKFKQYFSQKNPNIRNIEERIFPEYIYVFNILFTKGSNTFLYSASFFCLSNPSSSLTNFSENAKY